MNITTNEIKEAIIIQNLESVILTHIDDKDTNFSANFCKRVRKGL